MNIIEIPLEHKMFDEEIVGTLDNFIYDEFSLIYTLSEKMVLGFTVFFTDGIDGLEFYLVRHGEKWVKNVFYQIKLDSKANSGFSVYCNNCEKKYCDIGYGLAEIIVRTMLYIMNAPRERTETAKTHNANERKTGSKKKENSIYLLDEIVDYVNENRLTVPKSGNRTITCPCWNVRGHYRHYKSGNTVFVKSYEKGKQKGKAKPKSKVYTV